MVRAPACQAGSCGFKSRLSRFSLVLLILITTLALFACSSKSLEDFRDEGKEISKELMDELKKIQSRQELKTASLKLKVLFNALVDLIIEAHQFKLEQGEREVLLSKEDLFLNEQLRNELNRIYRMEGAQEIVEKAQEDALFKLHKYLQTTE